MSVKAVLDKLCDHNEGVIGCLATHGGRTHHNLKDAHELIDAASVGDEAARIFELMDQLADPAAKFDEFRLEMSQHCAFVKRLDEGVLIVVAKPTERSLHNRVKVGINLFVNPLKRALETSEPESEPATPETAVEEPPKSAKRRRLYRGVAY